MLSTATLRQREAVYCWQFSAYRLAQVFNPLNMFGLGLDWSCGCGNSCFSAHQACGCGVQRMGLLLLYEQEC